MAPGSAFKDVVLAIAIVGGVLGSLFLYTGVWPPMVVVESGSMMHAPCTAPGQPDFCDPQVGYGKLGTIDPGDMVFVKRAPRREDIAPLAEAGNPSARNYGKPGDVVVYFPFNNRGDTPIIHRAMAYVEVLGVTDVDRCRTEGPPSTAQFSIFWDGREQSFGASGIQIEALGLRDYKPCWSGFITKGDNPVTNTQADAAIGTDPGTTFITCTPTDCSAVRPLPRGVTRLSRQPVQVSWIEGKAVGELPWFGLIKLALNFGSPNYNCAGPTGFPVRQGDPACIGAVRVMNAYAPADLWVMLGVSVVVIAVAPLGYDMYVLRRQKERAEMRARGEEPPPSLFEQLLARLGLRRPKAGGPGEGQEPEEPGAADPRKAFEPPEAPPAQPPSSAPSAPSPAERPEKRTTKFERVQKK